MMIIKKHFAFRGENLIGRKYIIALHMYIADSAINTNWPQ